MRVVKSVAILIVLALVSGGGLLVYRWHAQTDRPTLSMLLSRARMLAAVRLHPAGNDELVALARLSAPADEWTTFAHDDRRSGLQTQPTGITRDTVGTLQRRWMRSLGEPVRASPLVAGGLVFAASDRGTVYALDAASGDLRWQRRIGDSVRMTPALVHGALLVGSYGALGAPGVKPHGAAFYALDAQTGAVRWRTPLPGLIRAEPVVLNGTIYEGLAGGDSFSGCFAGRVVALDERTGALRPSVWQTSDRPNDGGGVWGPLSTDGSSIYFGTGNTCRSLGMAAYGDSIVALSPDLRLRWHASAAVPGVDDSDVGGGVALVGARAYVAGKSGYLYELERASGAILSRRDLAPFARNGGSIGTPTGDGSVVLISGGNEKNPDLVGSTAGSVLSAFDQQGRVKYRLHSTAVVNGYAAFVPGVGFAVLDRQLVGFDAATGERLWSTDLGAYAYASPVVVPSGVYAATDAGDVFAFGSRAAATRLAATAAR
jgi:polyvinyl alcohol dehydrogenase (cytochrome)